MYPVFESIKYLLKIDSVCIDNNIFRLHYKATMLILISFSLLTTQQQYFGDPIDCNVSDLDRSFMNTYCWIHSTFTILTKHEEEIGENVPHPGISNLYKNPELYEKKSHKYYQWVTLFLYIQVII